MLTINNLAFAVILVFTNGILVLSAVETNLRGVSISRKPLYPKKDTFTCIDGKKTIKYNQINDDYCDCEDGSDEPGTSACPNGLFHCTNAGHRTKNIPSARVNDGICDCCDASDEYDSNAKCINNCLALGREERHKERIRQELLKKGAEYRNDLSAKGKAMKIERENRLAELNQRKADAEAIRLEKEQIKKETELYENEALEVYREMQEMEKREKQEKEALENQNEASETFTKFDSNKDGIIELAEIQTRISFDKDRNGEVSVEEAKFFLDERENVDKDTFTSVCWPRIKPYLMLDSGLFVPPRNEEEHINDSEKEGNEGEHHEEADLQNAEEVEQDPDQEHEPVDPPEHDQDEHPDDEEEEDTGEGEVEEQNSTPQPQYDPATQLLVEKANAARNEYSEADRTVREIETEIKDLNDAISKDYGRDHEFAPLDGECFNYEDREYVYKLCPFDRTSQQPRSGGSETRLGSWDRWDGKQYRYSHMLYSNGASCWNGPQRSALVQVECGLENRVISVTEPNRCEYHIMFETPAACFNDDATADGDEENHDEL